MDSDVCTLGATGEKPTLPLRLTSQISAPGVLRVDEAGAIVTLVTSCVATGFSVAVLPTN